MPGRTATKLLVPVIAVTVVGLPLAYGLTTTEKVAGVGMAALRAQAVEAASQQGAQAMQAAAQNNNQAPNPNCTIIVPDNPLTPAGLATPYQLVATDPAAGPCDEANGDQSAFVQGVILDPATGAITTYSPVVVNMGKAPAIQPTPPQLPANAVVGIWFGYQGDVLTLRGASGISLQQGACINGTPNSPFGQFAYCNAPQFYAAAQQAMMAGKLAVPSPGTASDGLPCPTTRDYMIVDQDQSDNLETTYLITANGMMAQNTAANRNALGGTKVQVNASDNRLLTELIDPLIGCQAWKIPDLADPGAVSATLATNEMQAAVFQPQPVALIPPNNPMVLNADGVTDMAKLNLYRAGAAMQPMAAPGAQAAEYCRTFKAGQARVQTYANVLAQAPSPDPAAGNNLFTFLAARGNGSWAQLGCQQLTGTAAPYAVVQAGDVVIAAQAVTMRVGAQMAPAGVGQAAPGQMVTGQAAAAQIAVGQMQVAGQAAAGQAVAAP